MTEMGHLIYCPWSENLHSVVRTLQSLSMCVCVCVCACVGAWVWVPLDSSYFNLSTRAP